MVFKSENKANCCPQIKKCSSLLGAPSFTIRNYGSQARDWGISDSIENAGLLTFRFDRSKKRTRHLEGDRIANSDENSHKTEVSLFPTPTRSFDGSL